MVKKIVSDTIYEAVVFDIDGTITTHISSWRYIHEQLGRWDALACRYQEQFLAGKISYRRFCELDAAHWRGLPEADMVALFRAVPYARNAPDCLRELKRLGFRLAALSTGLQYLPERLRAELGFDHVFSNRLCVENGRLTGGVQINISHGAKGRVLRRVLDGLGVAPERVIAVGDSEGDIPLAAAAGYAIAFNSSSPELSARVDYNCRSDDFREVFRAIVRAAGLSAQGSTCPGPARERPGSRR